MCYGDLKLEDTNRSNSKGLYVTPPLLPRANPRVFAECLSNSCQDSIQVKFKLKDKQLNNKGRNKEKLLP